MNSRPFLVKPLRVGTELIQPFSDAGYCSWTNSKRSGQKFAGHVKEIALSSAMHGSRILAGRLRSVPA
jgi:hypothetical protein